VPKGSGLTTIFGAQFIFVARDINEFIHITSGGYSNNSVGVFFEPISGTHADGANINCWKDNVWNVCKGDIDQFRVWGQSP
jgi:hypothetical protein